MTTIDESLLPDARRNGAKGAILAAQLDVHVQPELPGLGHEDVGK